MKRTQFFYCMFAGLFASAYAASETASIFVQDPAVFHQQQAELEKLKSNLENANEGLDSLLNSANRIAEMNDRCAVISINDVMGDECWTFYRVELPAFEEEYLRVTGEVRLGHMETARGLEDRKLQIDACVDALYSFASSKNQYVNLNGGVSLEPLSKGFQANYDFTLQYDPAHRKNVFDIAQKWGETCREMVIRQGGEGFAPYFLEKLEKLNDNLAKDGSLAVYKTDTTNAPVLFADISKPVRSAYYLNGVKLFHSRVASGGVSESNLRIAFKGNAVAVDGEPVVVKNGKAATFKGSVEYPEQSASLNGRWFWENQGNTDGVDFGPEYDADSLAAVQVAESSEAATRDSAATEKRRGTHFSPWIGISGGMAIFSDKHYKAFGLEKDETIYLADAAAAARVRLNFGETGEGFVAVGAGAYIGAGISDEIERLYVAPLAQVELGYKMFGFRETAVIAIPEEDSEPWMQFRSGLFFSFGVVGVELGHALVTNLGQGGYVSFFFEM